MCTLVSPGVNYLRYNPNKKAHSCLPKQPREVFIIRKHKKAVMLNVIESMLIHTKWAREKKKKRVYLAEEQNAIVGTGVSVAIVRTLGEHIGKVNSFSKHITSYRRFRRSYPKTCLVSQSNSLHYAIENPSRGEENRKHWEKKKTEKPDTLR